MSTIARTAPFVKPSTARIDWDQRFIDAPYGSPEQREALNHLVARANLEDRAIARRRAAETAETAETVDTRDHAEPYEPTAEDWADYAAHRDHACWPEEIEEALEWDALQNERWAMVGQWNAEMRIDEGHWPF